jgi:hypothetical protein
MDFSSMNIIPRFGSLLLLAGTLFLAVPHPAQARPAHKRALADYLGPYLSQQLNDCRTCHVPDSGKADPLGGDDKPHNPFGARLKEIKRELSKAGKSTSIAARLQAIAEEDSDGDGVPNLLELITGHNPGDPNDKPTDAEIAAGRKKLAEFLKYTSAYPWTPFDTVKRPDTPLVKDMAWIRNSIDAFIAKEHEERGLRPRPQATKSVLLRRVYLDLTGLPATPEELHAFLDDPATDAFEKVVDRLLESPRYGERWGRHWMDVWRYSDWAGWTDGGQIRDSQPHIWRWRDWIVESLNEDKGYDRMVQEMLAADELAPTDEKALRATGYLVRNYKMLSREKWMQDTVEHTAMGFLGITLGCARCHDHMFDPILQKEYYQVRAIFEPHQVRLDQRPGQLDTKVDGLPRAYDADLGVHTHLFIRGDDRNPDKSKVLSPGVPEALGGKALQVNSISLPLYAHSPDKQPFVIADQLAAKRAENKRTRERETESIQRLNASPMPAGSISELLTGALARQKLVAERYLAGLEHLLALRNEEAFLMLIRVEGLEDKGKKGTPEWESAAMVARNTQRVVAALQAKCDLLKLMQTPLPPDKNARGDLERRRTAAEVREQETAKALLAAPDTAYETRRTATYPNTSSGRRLAFARWLTDRSNPLAARVAMNHIWMRHFGQAIVPSVTDFGRNGRPASHPALLDWLAAEFMERGWSMKQMHRLIVTSSTYRMASTPDDANLARDRDNIYLWRMNSRRLEAEAVRDCIFYVAGKLDLTMGGPDIPHSKGLTTPRRSIYFQHAQEKQMEFLKIFDEAAVTECYRRKESVVPQQALALNNSELVRARATDLARTIGDHVGSDPDAFTVAAFERVLGRGPTRDERTECVGFLRSRAEKYTKDAPTAPNSGELHARESLMHVLLNHSDFVTVR